MLPLVFHGKALVAHGVPYNTCYGMMYPFACVQICAIPFRQLVQEHLGFSKFYGCDKLVKLHNLVKGTGLTATAPAFEIKPGYAMGRNSGKYKFIGNFTSRQACEAACTAEPICVQFEHRSDTNLGNHWCALYNTTSIPIPNADYDIGCRGTCTTRTDPKELYDLCYTQQGTAEKRGRDKYVVEPWC